MNRLARLRWHAAKWTTMLAVCLTALCLTACAGVGTGSKYDTFCLTASPTYLTDAEIDALEPVTQRKILADNEYGAVHCGWKPSDGSERKLARTPVNQLEPFNKPAPAVVKPAKKKRQYHGV